MTHVALHVRDLDATLAFYGDYCGMRLVHSRDIDDGDPTTRVVWLAEPGRETELIFVFIPGGHSPEQPAGDYSHLGFAVETREHVDEVAEKARRDGRLVWEPSQQGWPVGYFCGVRDPDGNVVEFSYGQPLGPGAVDP